MVAEKRCVSNAARVHRVEHDILRLVEPAVHLKDCQHVASLSILVRLATEKNKELANETKQWVL